MLDRTNWKSPVTNTVMQEVQLEGMSVHFDAETGGYWLERGELDTLAKHHHADMQPVETGAFGTTHSGRICPQDGATQLTEFEFGEHSGIKLDICPDCKGIWLDGGELEKVLRYLESDDFGANLPHEQQDDHIKITDRVMMFLYQLTEHPPLY